MIKKVLKKSWSVLDSPLHSYVEQYGDLIFDLCESTLWSPAQAQISFRIILKKIHTQILTQSFSKYERAWILRITASTLIELHREHGEKSSAQEQLQLDSESDIQKRLKHFFHYFRRLAVENQILLLLKNKHGLSFSEIAMILETPEGSLKVKHQQSLSILEEWLWKTQ